MSGAMLAAGESPPRPGAGRRRILFVAEAVTLCHMVRPVVLARTLDPADYDVHLACDPRYLPLFRELPFRLHRIWTIPSERFLAALDLGQPLFDLATLRAYAREDLEVLERVAPDLVIGDMRLSLAVSARLAGVPYVTITNAHWSPYARPRFLVPELIHTRRWGVPLAQAAFTLLRPLLFAHHALPLNRLRREYGLPAVGFSLPQVFSEADETLYADPPEVVPLSRLPRHHHYLGPLLWSHETETPAWWHRLPQDHPLVYVTLGSSGRGNLLPAILEGLAGLPVTVIAATMGRLPAGHRAPNAWLADSLPAGEAAARAALVICNGGSATAYRALAAGTPVLGLPSNLDHYLTMACLQEAGAADFVRAGQVTAGAVAQAVRRMLDSPGYRARAARLQQRMAASDPGACLRAVLAARLGALEARPADSAWSGARPRTKNKDLAARSRRQVLH